MSAEQVSLSIRASRLESEVRTCLRKHDISTLERHLRDKISELQQDLADARRYISDYELSETREEQLQSAKLAKKWLRAVRRLILSLSEHNIFGAIDVAHLSAQVEQLIEELN